ncbi:MAG: S26 family signal peptidase [Acidimicrobiales bacterium]
MSRRARSRTWPGTVALVLVASAGLLWGGWLLAGGRLFWVGSPSMGRVAPVGSLVVTRPLPADQPLRLGEVVVFHPGLDVPAVYVHRIEAILPVPGHPTEFRTKGDLNQLPDPWVITRASVVGRPVAIIPAIGWLYRSATWLLFGAAVVAGLSFVLTGGPRRVLLVLGPMLLVAVPAIIDHPFVSGFLYGSGQNGNRVVARVVDTGILPVTFTVHGGHPVRAVPGQEVVAIGTTVAHQTVVPVRVAASLPWWGWLLVVAVCLLPLAANAWLSRFAEVAPDVDDPSASGEAGPGAGGEDGTTGDDEEEPAPGTATGEEPLARRAPWRASRPRSSQPVPARLATEVAGPAGGS